MEETDLDDISTISSVQFNGNTQHTVSEEQKEKIREAFQLFDSDHDCILNRSELQCALLAIGFFVDDEDLNRIMKTYDIMKTGTIGYSDYMQLTTQWFLNKDPHKDLMYIFHLIDDDNSGSIDLKKLRRVNELAGTPLAENELRDMIREFDSDKDGHISESDFIKIMTGLVH